ncbi:anti-sigma factor [Nocardia sp. NPDC059239]|uniref:anti-sigma factor n=1 Tax=unclassified Nocardia TaxID=2637762 RepID=UPI0036924A2A
MSGTPQDAGIGGKYWPATVLVDLSNDGRARVFTDGAVPVSLSGEVAVRLPADARELAMLRALTETIMLTADFTIDVVTDVRVALDEVATALIAAAVPGAWIECGFLFDEHRMRVRAAAVTSSDGGLIEHAFGWRFVEELTDSIAVSRADFDTVRCGYPVVVELVRCRGDTGRE